MFYTDDQLKKVTTEQLMEAKKNIKWLAFQYIFRAANNNLFFNGITDLSVYQMQLDNEIDRREKVESNMQQALINK